MEHMSDQSALPNLNATWVNAKGMCILFQERRYTVFERSRTWRFMNCRALLLPYCRHPIRDPANRVNPAGAWTIHIVLILALKILFDIVPGMSQETSWTLTNISYMFGSYLMFHWVRGVPFEFNAGAYDNLNMWEQIDNGDQYTPAKKFLLSVPIVLFLLSTHYTHYGLTYFTINFLAVLAVVIPKLPSVSRCWKCQSFAAVDNYSESSHESGVSVGGS